MIIQNVPKMRVLTTFFTLMGVSIMNNDKNYPVGVEGTTRRARPVKATFSVDTDPYWKSLKHDDKPDETNGQTFTITRVVEFDGKKAVDVGVTIEFFGPSGPLQTISMDIEYARSLRDALNMGIL